MAEAPSLADRIEAVLPQTQCTRCGYPDCRAYAEAIARGEAGIAQCPPGGAEGVQRLSALTGLPVVQLDQLHGIEGPLKVALIDENWCIGCTLCIKACPVDCIVGAPKSMHTVIEPICTGCELCVPACPVDCISLETVTPGRTGWAAWSPAQADTARQRYAFHRLRVERQGAEQDERLAAKAASKLSDLESASQLTDPDALARKRVVVEAALERARARRRNTAGG
jgi:electron transport complex protein RnfB